MKSLVLHDNVIFRRDRDIVPGLIRGDKPITIPAGTPSMKWTGPKMTEKAFRVALSFCKWTYDKWKGEAQGKLFFNPATGDWQFAPLPQYTPSGMTTDEDKNDPRRGKIIGEWTKKGYVLCGTLHHHCGISSFQSGTDLADEKSTNGLHVTVGMLGRDKADYHLRYVHKSVLYNDLPFSDFIEIPGENAKAEDSGILNLSNLPGFPGEWTEIFTERPRPAVRTWGKPIGNGHYLYGGSSAWEDWRDDGDVKTAKPAKTNETDKPSDGRGGIKLSTLRREEQFDAVVPLVRTLFMLEYVDKTGKNYPSFPRDLYPDDQGYVFHWTDLLPTTMDREELFTGAEMHAALVDLLTSFKNVPLFTRNEYLQTWSPSLFNYEYKDDAASLVKIIRRDALFEYIPDHRDVETFSNWMKGQWYLSRAMKNEFDNPSFL